MNRPVCDCFGERVSEKQEACCSVFPPVWWGADLLIREVELQFSRLSCHPVFTHLFSQTDLFQLQQQEHQKLTVVAGEKKKAYKYDFFSSLIFYVSPRMNDLLWC